MVSIPYRQAKNKETGEDIYFDIQGFNSLQVG